jgi:hypothetical protein
VRILSGNAGRCATGLVVSSLYRFSSRPRRLFPNAPQPPPRPFFLSQSGMTNFYVPSRPFLMPFSDSGITVFSQPVVLYIIIRYERE